MPLPAGANNTPRPHPKYSAAPSNPCPPTTHHVHARRYNDFYMTLFNVVFTSLTPLAIGMFDRDVDRDMGLKYPQLYRQGE